MGKPEPLPDETSELEEVKSNAKRNRKTKAEVFPKNLPIVIDQVLVPKEVQANPDDYECIGEEHSDELELTPASAYFRRTTRKKYKKKTDKTQAPLIEPALQPSVPGTKLSPNFASQIICDRYLDHLPFYRQSQRLKRDFDMEISDRTLMGWTHAIAEHLEPIAKIIHQDLLKEEVLQIDETPIKYQKGKGSTQNGYLWVANSSVTNQVYYLWSTSRSTNSLKTLLGYDAQTNTLEFTGTIQCDGYSAYTSLIKDFKAINLGGCLAHIRRKFIQLQDQGESAPWLKQLLNYIQILYGIERNLKKPQSERPPDWKTHHQRQRISKVVCERIKHILNEQLPKHRPKSVAGVAIQYALGQWSSFIAYLEEPKLDIDNNPVERAVRPTKLGAKNWMFMGSAQAGENHAILYTLLENAKRAGLNPRDYLVTAIQGLKNNQPPEELTPRAIAERSGLQHNTKIAA